MDCDVADVFAETKPRLFQIGDPHIAKEEPIHCDVGDSMLFVSQPIMLIVQPVRVRRWKMTMNHLEITDLGDRGDPAQASSVVKVLTGAGRAND